MGRRKRMRKGSLGTCSRSKKQKHAHGMPFLPEDIIFHILVLLPADFLYECGRLVCKTWARIIGDRHFVEKNVKASKSGTLVRAMDPSSLCVVELEKGDLTVRRMKYDIPYDVKSNCDGVFLLEGYEDGDVRFSVANFVTGQILHLPFITDLNQEKSMHQAQVTRIPGTGEIKVCVYGGDTQERCCWFVFAVGSMLSWKKVFCSQFEQIRGHRPLWRSSVEGVAYFFEDGGKIIALDLSDETSHCISLPFPVNFIQGFFKMGKNLLVVQQQFADIRIFVLEDLHSGKWSNPYTITGFKWVVWAMAGFDDQTILFKLHYQSKKFLTYNLKTFQKRIIKFDIKSYSHYCSVGYTKSLVSW